MSEPLAERFWSKVQITPACWEWQAARHTFGYGKYWDGERVLDAHRVSYAFHNGPIPSGMVVRHKCDNPPCVNPDHLELGTQAQNIADAVARGRYGDRRGRGQGRLGEQHQGAKLCAEAVREIRASSDPARVLAERYGVSRSLIGQVKSLKIWSHVA